jgi:hypothetical protein
MLETPKGPGLDARESAVGTEQLLAEMEAKHNANSAKTPIQEAMASRGDAIQALARAKENLGAVATEQPVHSEASRVEIGPDGQVISNFDRKMDGASSSKPVGVGGRVV